jgi:5-methylcytosine-specific restriction protein A
MEIEDSSVSEEQIRREKEKARRLRRSAWWMRKIGGGSCYYCRRRVGRTALTMDHVVPLSRGGKSAKGNVVPACKECNNKKKYLLPIEWNDYLEALSAELWPDKEL